MNKNTLTTPLLFSCFFAGCLEIYDFVIFGLLAPVIYKNYLSFLDEGMGLIITYILFAVGFLFRPLGSIIFGYIGDKYGRKKALVLSLSFMGTASLGMCILPSYEQIGILSCFLIVLIRIIQGISVGGEFSGVAIYAIEHTNKKHIGKVGAVIFTGVMTGVLLAALVGKVLQTELFPEYSWRFAFLLGFGLSIIGYFIRKKLKESPAFLKDDSNIQGVPLFHGLKHYKTQFLASILLAGANNANFYFLVIFIPNYLKSLDSVNMGFNNLFFMCLMVVFVPLFGWLSDKFSRVKMLISACCLLTLYNIFFLDLLISETFYWLRVIYIIISSMLVSVLIVGVNVFIVEIFPIKCRYSCVALSYSIGAAVFGGTSPMICSLIMEYIGNEPIYLGMYISFISFLGAIGGYLVLRKYKNNSKTSVLKAEKVFNQEQSFQKG
jgi:MHS family proline/betaine transporter-like MFS transporter